MRSLEEKTQGKAFPVALTGKFGEGCWSVCQNHHPVVALNQISESLPATCSKDIFFLDYVETFIFNCLVFSKSNELILDFIPF